MRTELHVHTDAASLAQAAAQAILRAIEAGLERRSAFTLVLAGGNTPRHRVTLTLPVLCAARDVMFLVAGADKRKALAAIVADPGAAAQFHPAAAVRPRHGLLWFVDAGAAPG